ncbi:3-hydroxyisobutyrate dehydrogenase-like beta-hydroxyacid dehydrogenase [Erwinia toletana]|uniref:3-hydroxyisobutyrate dehydrogenase-like beta-hydroxyacid dehydrogenase n=1 Tax=Winslowiella toletana TaxID=92490 RepID=A0ABS4P3Y0_9GAMM|nr:NAD(P)-dependent oxidoreductase [Winslowiella toletana]MBP2167356.1 3-hydroxyisobutyrate dehydrogenase-like beta-hydroxyacid dehydrogenase [Winslowiella toletana]
MRIGFIGLGSMGQPMAENLLQAHYSLNVWNRSAAPAEALEKLGATVCESPAEAAQCDVLISMLADDAITRQVIVGHGALESLGDGAIWINMATVSVDFTHEMQTHAAANGVSYLAAPVLGRNDVAAAGKLNILTAGDKALIARVQPIFDILGQQTWYFGSEPTQAVTAKLAANFMLGSAIEAMAEASALVRAHGIPAADFLGMLTSTLFNAPAYKGYGELIAQQRYSPPGFKLRLGLKDIRLAQQAAEAKNVPMPFASVIRDNCVDALAHNEGDLEWAALAKVAARRSGLK